MRGLILALVFLAGCATAESPPSPSRRDLMAEMQAVEAARNAAIREVDIAALERIYAREFEGLTATGAPVTRDDLFAVFQRAVRTSLRTVPNEPRAR